jgi:hypothetical protein
MPHKYGVKKSGMSKKAYDKATKKETKKKKKK